MKIENKIGLSTIIMLIVTANVIFIRYEINKTITPLLIEIETLKEMQKIWIKQGDIFKEN